MTASTFDEILAQGIRAGNIPARSQRSRDWFRKRASSADTTAQKIIQKERAKQRGRVEPGSMYLFSYDPKHKKTLPYYDRYPLIFMIGEAKGGFLGINMHFLPLRQRAILMDALYSLVNNKKYDEMTKLKISYDILKSASKFKLFKPCVKHYLGSHVRSRFIEISPAEWDIALMLPIQSFQKASSSQIWKESLQKV
jgi:hypothetical protein